MKSVVLLNGDRLTLDAQSALRRCIELYNHSTRFFMVVEDKHKLLSPIISRFCSIHVPRILVAGKEVNLHSVPPDGCVHPPDTVRIAVKIIGTTGDNYTGAATQLYEKGCSVFDMMTIIEKSDVDVTLKYKYLDYMESARVSIDNRTGFALHVCGVNRNASHRGFRKYASSVTCHRWSDQLLGAPKDEYAARFIHVLAPQMNKGIRDIFNEAVAVCSESGEQHKYLMTFQNFLAKVPTWSAATVEKEAKRIEEDSGCTYMPELLACVHVAHLKLLTSIRPSETSREVEIEMPTLATFIHKAYSIAARKLWQHTFLFETGIFSVGATKECS